MRCIRSLTFTLLLGSIGACASAPRESGDTDVTILSTEPIPETAAPHGAPHTPQPTLRVTAQDGSAAPDNWFAAPTDVFLRTDNAPSGDYYFAITDLGGKDVAVLPFECRRFSVGDDGAIEGPVGDPTCAVTTGAPKDDQGITLGVGALLASYGYDGYTQYKVMIASADRFEGFPTGTPYVVFSVKKT